MGAMEHDFLGLSQAVTDSTAKDSSAPQDPPEMWWHFQYPEALDKALNLDNYGPLTELLRAGAPIHPLLLPALADAITARIKRKRGGRPRRLTLTEAYRIAGEVARRTRGGETKTSVVGEIALRYEVDESTVSRAIKRGRVYRYPSSTSHKPSRL